MRHTATERNACRGYATVFVCALMLSASSALAQVFVPSIYPSVDHKCELYDTGGQATVQVRLHSGGIAFPTHVVKFSVSTSPEFTGTVAAFEFPWGFSGSGNPTDGFLINFNDCLESPLLVTLTYQLFGTSGSCGTIDVVPYPGDESIVVLPCAEGPWVATQSQGPIVVNPGDGCGGTWCTLATQQSTWGRVKALYR